MLQNRYKAEVAELADAHGSGLCVEISTCGFKSHLRHFKKRSWRNWHTHKLEELGSYERVGSSPTERTRGRIAQLVQSASLTQRKSEVQILFRPPSRGSQGGHGACLKNMRWRFDSAPRHYILKCGRSSVAERLLAKEKAEGANPFARSNLECGVV